MQVCVAPMPGGAGKLVMFSPKTAKLGLVLQNPTIRIWRAEMKRGAMHLQGCNARLSPTLG